MIGEVFRTGELTLSQKKGVVTIIYKKGEKDKIKNYRPITLLNVDYKIIAKIFANRMKNVIAEIIGPGQVCAVPGRCIWENLYIVRDVLEDVMQRDQGIALLSLDFEKAYDRVNHDFMFTVLTRFGFSKGFINKLKVLYKNVTSEILVNGFKTEPIEVKSGVRQGCPLSPILFICSIEPLLLALQRDKIIKGVSVPGKTECIKSLGYMDDVVILCSNKESVNRVILWADIFNSAANFKLNIEKCECNVYGKWVDFENCKVKLERGNSRILGIVFSQNVSGELSWAEALEKIKKKLSMWKLRSLSIIGKVLIVKAVILPILLYVGLVFLPNYLWMRRFIREIFVFIWSSNMEKLKREIMYRELGNGGKGVPNVQQFLELKYIQFIIKLARQDKWASYFVKYGAGWILNRHRWFKTDIKKPYSFSGTRFYNVLDKIIKRWDLFKYSEVELVNINKICTDWRKQEAVCPVENFNSKISKEIWNMVVNKNLTNSQRDLAWALVHKCLPVKDFQYRRGLLRSPKCPREGCTENETCMHFIWNCKFAQRMWRDMGVVMKAITGLSYINYEVVMFGRGLKCARDKMSITWVIINIVKEVMWKARNLLIFKNNVLDYKQCKKMICAEMYIHYLKDKRLKGRKAETDWNIKIWNIS
uniref:Reverse transcriptase domain-containing protein n=1 Tax=Xenopus tropicalis TaxID=8364 RepID=A0A803K3B6_XENTR